MKTKEYDPLLSRKQKKMILYYLLHFLTMKEDMIVEALADHDPQMSS
jgi:hypothetical protein